MIVAIAGAHGNIAMRLTRLLVARGDTVIGLIRNPAHAEAVAGHGASAVVCDLEQATVQEIADSIAGADVTVFAAGAGPGSGAARKLTMDRDGAVKLLQAARSVDAHRYLIISSVGAENPPEGDDTFSVYLRAKSEADKAIQASDREWTVVRPGRLTDDPGTGHVRIEATPFRGSVPRDDVAEVLARLAHDSRGAGRILYVNAGEEPVDAALENALGTDAG